MSLQSLFKYPETFQSAVWKHSTLVTYSLSTSSAATVTLQFSLLMKIYSTYKVTVHASCVFLSGGVGKSPPSTCLSFVCPFLLRHRLSCDGPDVSHLCVCCCYTCESLSPSRFKAVSSSGLIFWLLSDAKGLMDASVCLWWYWAKKGLKQNELDNRICYVSKIHKC